MNFARLLLSLSPSLALFMQMAGGAPSRWGAILTLATSAPGAVSALSARHRHSST